MVPVSCISNLIAPAASKIMTRMARPADTVADRLKAIYMLTAWTGLVQQTVQIAARFARAI
jgi:hypothetical protein